MTSRSLWIIAAFALSALPAESATLTQQQLIPFDQPSFASSFVVSSTSVPYRNPVTTDRRVEIAAPPLRVSLPQFDPALGTLTGVELDYTLGRLRAAGQNSILANVASGCRSRTACRKDVKIDAFFAHGLDIGTVLRRAIDPIAGRRFDVAVTSSTQADGTQPGDGTRRSVPVLAVSGFGNGVADRAQFRDGQVRPFVGTGSLGASINSAVAAILTLTCTPVFDFEANECAQDARVFLESDGFVRMTYTYEVPDPAPIPLPAGLPLLGGALLGMAAWRRFTSSRGTT